jgi:hypothetical protein
MVETPIAQLVCGSLKVQVSADAPGLDWTLYTVTILIAFPQIPGTRNRFHGAS